MLLLLWCVWRCPQNEHGCSHKGRWLAKWRGVHWMGRGGRKGLVCHCLFLEWKERWCSQRWDKSRTSDSLSLTTKGCMNASYVSAPALLQAVLPPTCPSSQIGAMKATAGLCKDTVLGFASFPKGFYLAPLGQRQATAGSSFSELSAMILNAWRWDL